MRRLIVVALLLVGGAAFAVERYVFSREAQLLTRLTPILDAPLLTPTDREKISLDGIKKIRVTVCTCSTASDAGVNCNTTDHYPITGGNLDVWYQRPDGGWAENVGLRLAAGGQDAGCQTFPDIESPGGNAGGSGRTGYMMVRASGVTKSYNDGGARVDVQLEGVTNE
jgi:hypothetical protein